MNKAIKKLFIIVAIPCVLLAAGYFALIQYYQENIPYGTWVNDIYCTGLTYEEAAERLAEQHDSTLSIAVVDIEEKVHHVTLPEDVYTLSFREGLAQSVISYGAAGLFTEKYITQQAQIHINQEKWDDYVETLDFMQVKNTTALQTEQDLAPSEQLNVQKGQAETFSRMTILKGEKGYELLDAYENLLDKQKASQVLLEAIESGKTRVSMAEAECYYTPDFEAADKKIIAEYEALVSFCNRMRLELTIQGEVVYTVDASVLKDWILLDDHGEYAYDKGVELMLDESKVQEYAENIAAEVTTYWGNPWQFTNHNGEIVEVKAGNFGRALKTYALTNALIKAFDERTCGSYELEFTFYPKSAADVDYGAGVGDSYVEVDVEEQHVYLYIDGECVLDSPCVTGNVSWDMETPKGVFYIEYKQRNRTLRGPGYATPVSYWMHFYNHCGFHDAGWRKKFGEDIYLKDGSHGCVNMSPEKAKELYALVYAGMPVVVY